MRKRPTLNPCPEHAEALARAAQPHRQAFAANLCALRALTHHSQMEIAQRMGKPQATYAKWETGYGTPKIHDIPALCRALGCTPNALFRGLTR